MLETDSIIDGSGMILSPGFIDTHSHHDWDTLRTVDAAISQGITTIIVGQDGRSFLPLEKYYDSLENYPLSTNLRISISTFFAVSSDIFCCLATERPRNISSSFSP